MRQMRKAIRKTNSKLGSASVFKLKKLPVLRKCCGVETLIIERASRQELASLSATSMAMLKMRRRNLALEIRLVGGPEKN